MATLTATRTLSLIWLAVLANLGTPLVAQSYRDFTTVRNRPQPYESLMQFRLGYRATEPENENLMTGLTDDGEIDGFFLYHTKNLARDESWALDMYAGKDGYYIGLKDQYSPAKSSQSRLEIFGRSRAFYREGFYSNGNYLTTGQYKGSDYGVRVATAQQLDKNLLLDISFVYHQYDFRNSDQTRVDYIIPDNFSTFAVDLTVEQNTLVLDRTLGLPQSGFLMTVTVENEQNTSDKTFGSSSTYTSSLPSGFWRGDLHMEAYFPNGKAAVWEFVADGGYYDSEDRVISYRAERVQGHIWADATLGYRINFGDSFVIKPFGELQFTRILQANGVSSDQEVFWGGGVDIALIFNQNMALVMNYSYVDNPSRPPVSYDNDFYGEHQLFIGMDVSFGSGYKTGRR